MPIGRTSRAHMDVKSRSLSYVLSLYALGL